MESILTSLYNKLVTWVEGIFNAIFGDWNYGILFGWLPQDIQAAVQFLILFLFCIALVKFIRSILPI